MRRAVLALMLSMLALGARAQDAAPTLDELWRDSCLWEVGSNTEKVPAARNAMIARGDAALAYIIPDKLDTKDTLITRALSVIITGIKGSATDRLRTALSNEKANVRRNAADLLGQLGDTASAGAIAKLLDDPDTRGGALTALGALKAQDAVSAVVAMLQRRDGVKERERVLAASTLGAIGGHDAEQALIATLGDDAAQVRFGAQAALEKLKAWAPLVPKLLDKTNGHARLHAIAAIGRIGDRGAAPSLVPLLWDDAAVVRGFAAEALGRCRRPEDVETLKVALAKETDAFARGKIDAALAAP